MTRSKAATPRAWTLLIATALLMGWLTGVADAGRRRIVVLEFEGDKAEKFHADVVKLIKKSHTVVSTDKWNGVAEEMSAGKLNASNVKKVAKKLNVDGVVSGVVEKRRDEYILRLKLRSGSSGEIVGSQINIKSESSRLDSQAARDVKDELIDVIGDLPSNRPGGDDDDEDEKPKKSGFGKKKVEEEDDEDEKPKKSGFGKKKVEEEEEEDEKPKKTAASKKEEEERAKKAKKEEEERAKKAKKEEERAAAKAKEDEDKRKKAKKAEDEKLAKKKKSEDDDEKPSKQKSEDDEEDEDDGKRKRVAKRTSGDEDDEDNSVDASFDPKMDDSLALSAGERAVDAVVGMSFTGRRMSFTFDPRMVTGQPAGYKQFAPVPGVYIDATIYPLAFGHKRKDILRGLGITILFDQAVGLKSETPGSSAKQATTEQRIALGAVLRYPLGSSPTSPVIGGSLAFNKQKFNISGMSPIPNVNYSMFEPELFFIFPLSAKMSLNLDAGVMLMLDAGQMVKHAQYGQASILGIEASVGIDYKLTKTIFTRALARLETLGYSFKGDGQKSRGITAARDSYFGGALSAGYLF